MLAQRVYSSVFSIISVCRECTEGGMRSGARSFFFGWADAAVEHCFGRLRFFYICRGAKSKVFFRITNLIESVGFGIYSVNKKRLVFMFSVIFIYLYILKVFANSYSKVVISIY